MPKGLKVFFTVLLIVALVIAVPLMQILTLARITVMNPHFYARSMGTMYEAVYDLALDNMARSFSYQEDGITEETVDKLVKSIRETLPPEDVSHLMREALPQMISYVLYGGEIPIIEYGEIVDDIREGFWDSYVIQDMLAERIQFTIEQAGLIGLDIGDIDEDALALAADALMLDTRFASYYTVDAREQARTVIYEACLAAARGEDVDLSGLPFPDAVDFMPLDHVVRELPFSAEWDLQAHRDFAMAMAEVHYAMNIFRIIFWMGWIGVLVFLALLYLTWMKKPSVFMNITGAMLIANGITVLLFALSCWFGGARLQYMARWGHWDIPLRYADTIQALSSSVAQPFARISFITGVLVLVGGVTLLILAPVVRKKEMAKRQAVA